MALEAACYSLGLFTTEPTILSTDYAANRLYLDDVLTMLADPARLYAESDPDTKRLVSKPSSAAFSSRMAMSRFRFSDGFLR